MRFTIATAVFSLAASAASAEIVATQHVEKLVTLRDASGAEQQVRFAADAAAPGEEIVYALRYRNENLAPAENLVLVMPVPGEIEYVEGSVDGPPAQIAFSADGGDTYVARGRLTVVENGDERAARSDEITHVRWTLTDPLDPGEAGEVSFRGALK